MKELLEELAAIGWKCIQIFDVNPVRFGHVKVRQDQSFEIQKDLNPTWNLLKDTHEYERLLKSVEEKTGFSPEAAEELILEYAYEIITEYAEPPLEDEASPLQKEAGCVRPKDGVIACGINRKATILLDDFAEERCVYEAIAPLLCLDSETMHIDLGSVGRIRPLRYSEREMYNLKYPNAILPYGPTNFDLLLELDCSSKAKALSPELQSLYVQRAGNVILAIRLLFGGEVGLEYVTANNHFSRIEFDAKIGDSQHWHRFSYRVRPVLIYGRMDSVIKSNLLDDLRFLVEALEVLEAEFVWRAFRRFGRVSRSDEDLQDRIVDLTIALEALLGPDRDIAARRAATLATQTPIFDPNLEALLLRCWRARDALAHGHSIEEALKRAKTNLEEMTRDAVETLRRCLLLAISMKPSEHDLFWKSIDVASESKTSKKALIAHIPDWMILTLQKMNA